MKRSVAIVGPTPAFLRWAIEQPCPFRGEHSRNVAAKTFTEVRSLRAISVAEIENRIFDGICLSPNVGNVQVEDAKGFPVSEIYAAYGGESLVKATCSNCPANIPVARTDLSPRIEFTKAGCFGWLPFVSQNEPSADAFESSISGFMSLLEHDGSGLNLIDADLLSKFETSFKSSGPPKEITFLKTDPAWYGIWCQKVFGTESLGWLSSVCESFDSESLPWLRLKRAVETCLTHELVLHVDVLPPGFSDGTSWKTQQQCRRCGAVCEALRCSVCSSDLTPIPNRKQKVLGLRPYLNLVSIFGREETQRLIDGFRQQP